MAVLYPAEQVAAVRAKREWTFSDLAVVVGYDRATIQRRATPPDEHGDGHIHLPVGDVPYLTDRFSATVRPRRLVLACDYEAVERARAARLAQGAGQ